MKTLLIAVAVLCVGCGDNELRVAQQRRQDKLDSLFAAGRVSRDSAYALIDHSLSIINGALDRADRLAADSAKCADDRLFGFPSYRECMVYCGKQWTETTVGDTIWGCVDSIHFATKRYYTERKPK